MIRSLVTEAERGEKLCAVPMERAVTHRERRFGVSASAVYPFSCVVRACRWEAMCAVRSGMGPTHSSATALPQLSSVLSALADESAQRRRQRGPDQDTTQEDREHTQHNTHTQHTAIGAGCAGASALLSPLGDSSAP